MPSEINTIKHRDDQGRLTSGETKIYSPDGTLIDTIRTRPNLDRSRITAIGRDDGFNLTPEEAYFLGRVLVEHAFECGFNPETGATEPDRAKKPSQFTLVVGRQEQVRGISRE